MDIKKQIDKNKSLKQKWKKHILERLKKKDYSAVLYGLSCNLGDKGDIEKFVKWIVGEMDPDPKLLKEITEKQK